MTKREPKPKGKAVKEPHNVDNGGPILRGFRTYIVVKEVGEIGDNGKVVMRVGYGDRIEASDKYPLASLLIPVLLMIVSSARYANQKAFDEDIAVLQGALKRLQYRK